MKFLKSKQSFLIYSAGQLFNLIVPFIILPHIINNCGLEGLGKISLGMSVAFFLILIVDYSYEIKGVKYISQNRNYNKRINKYLATAIFNKFLLFSISASLFLILFFSSNFFLAERLLFFFSLAPVLAQVFNPSWYLQALEKYSSFAAINFLSKLIYLILILTFITTKKDYIYVNLILGFSSFIINLYFLIIIIKENRIGFKDISITQSKIVLKNDFSLCVSQLLLSIKQQAPIFLSGYMLSYIIAGQFKIIEQLYSLFRSGIQLYLRYFYPKLCFLIKQEKLKALFFWKKYTLILKVMILFGITFIFFFTEYILRFLNIDYLKNHFIVLNFKISLLISLLFSLNLPLEQLMFANNKNKEYIIIVFIVTVLNLILSYFLILELQILGVIFTVIITEIIQTIAYKYFLRNEFN